jgi:hypothetical protein
MPCTACQRPNNNRIRGEAQIRNMSREADRSGVIANRIKRLQHQAVRTLPPNSLNRWGDRKKA